MDDARPEQLLTAVEAAAILRINLAAFYSYARRGVVPIVRIERKARVSLFASSLEAMAREGPQNLDGDIRRAKS